MKAEQEIVLQKKMIIIFALLILVFAMGILNIQKKNIKVAKIEENNDVIKVCTEYTASEEFFKIEVSGDISGDSGDIKAEEEKIIVAEEPVKKEKSTTKVEKPKEIIPVVEDKPMVVQITVSGENSDSEDASGEDTQNPAIVASRGSYVRDKNTPPTEYQKVIQVKATAYCLCKKCCGKSPDNPRYGYTASGIRIVPGTGMKVIAVDTSVVPLGTNVYIEGLNGAPNYGYAIAADTGSAIKNNKIDLYMDTHGQALAWGVRYVNMYVLDD